MIIQKPESKRASFCTCVRNVDATACWHWSSHPESSLCTSSSLHWLQAHRHRGLHTLKVTRTTFSKVKLRTTFTDGRWADGSLQCPASRLLRVQRAHDTL